MSLKSFVKLILAVASFIAALMFAIYIFEPSYFNVLLITIIVLFIVIGIAILIWLIRDSLGGREEV